MTSFWAGFAAGAVAAAIAAAVLRVRARKRHARMLSFISHELNTPLTAVNMTVLNFMSGVFGPLAKEHGDWMAMMREQVQRMNGLVGELRDFIHLEFHRDLRIRTEPVDLGRLLDGLASQQEGSVTRGGARLQLDVPAGLPQVRADADRLKRVLSAAIEHAKKFRRDGSVSVAARADDGGVEVRITFTSHPLPPGEAERMLDLYYPVAAAGSQLLPSVGAGLGLSRIVVERQGGALRLTSAADGATELRLRLPRA